MVTSSTNADSQLFDRINELLPQVSESVLQEIWIILSNVTKNEEYSGIETNTIKNHSAFLNGYNSEDEGLYDEY
jgi:hypothetical protein